MLQLSVSFVLHCHAHGEAHQGCGHCLQLCLRSTGPPAATRDTGCPNDSLYAGPSARTWMWRASPPGPFAALHANAWRQLDAPRTSTAYCTMNGMSARTACANRTGVTKLQLATASPRRAAAHTVMYDFCNLPLTMSHRTVRNVRSVVPHTIAAQLSKCPVNLRSGYMHLTYDANAFGVRRRAFVLSRAHSSQPSRNADTTGQPTCPKFMPSCDPPFTKRTKQALSASGRVMGLRPCGQLAPHDDEGGYSRMILVLVNLERHCGHCIEQQQCNSRPLVSKFRYRLLKTATSTNGT